MKPIFSVICVLVVTLSVCGCLADTAEAETTEAFTHSETPHADTSLQTSASEVSQEITDTEEVTLPLEESSTEETTGEAEDTTDVPDTEKMPDTDTETHSDTDEPYITAEVTTAVKDLAPTVTADTDRTHEETTGVPHKPEETTVYVEPVTEIHTESEAPVTTAPPEETTVVNEPVTADETEKLTDTEEPETTEAPIVEYDFDVLAAALVSEDVNKAIALINKDRRDIGTVSYPFEKRDARSSLTECQAELYDELYSCASKLLPYRFEPDRDHGYGDVIAAANAMYSDHPELSFYSMLREAKVYSRVVGMELYYFMPHDENIPYDGNEDGIHTQLSLMDAVCRYITERMPEEYSTYDKYRYIAAVLCIITEYDHDYEAGIKSENAYGALIHRLSICRGYSKAFEYLCEYADLYCRFVSGANMAGEVHMWNLVKLESGTYHVDTTWSDTTYGGTLGSGWMKHFMLTQAQTESNHIIDDGTVATGTPLFK